MIRVLAVPIVVLLMPGLVLSEQAESFDYWGPQREMIRRGQQAIFMCNGLFTSNRTLEQVFAQELKLPAGADRHRGRRRLRRRSRASDGRDRQGRDGARDARGVSRRASAASSSRPTRRSTTSTSLPSLTLPPPAGDPATIAVARRRPRRRARRCRRMSMRKALQAASDWAFNRDVTRAGDAQPARRSGRPDHSRALRAGRGRDDENADVVDGEEPRRRR